MKRYLVLLAVVAGLGAVGLVAGRSMRRPAGPEPAPATLPQVALDLTITPDGQVSPSFASVPKDHLVRLRVTNRGARPASLALMGYEDRLAVARIAPDSVWRGEFVADRPGEDFGWTLEGAPAGRLAVTGSHLVEGHR